MCIVYKYTMQIKNEIFIIFVACKSIRVIDYA